MKNLIISILVLSFSLSCNTSEVELQTPSGSQSANQFDNYIILGVISRNFNKTFQNNLNIRTDDNLIVPYTEEVQINIPVGTELIIPATRGVLTGFGGENEEEERVTIIDRHLSSIGYNIEVKDINAVNSSTSPPTQTATIIITALLTDQNFDDPWYIDINFNLLCLGKISEVYPNI